MQQHIIPRASIDASAGDALLNPIGNPLRAAALARRATPMTARAREEARNHGSRPGGRGMLARAGKAAWPPHAHRRVLSDFKQSRERQLPRAFCHGTAKAPRRRNLKGGVAHSGCRGSPREARPCPRPPRALATHGRCAMRAGTCQLSRSPSNEKVHAPSPMPAKDAPLDRALNAPGSTSTPTRPVRTWRVGNTTVTTEPFADTKFD